MVDYDRNDPLLTICAHVTALERASKNRLVELFCKLREASGWVIQRVDEKVKESPYDEARRLRKEERAEMLLKALTLTDSDFIDLDERACNGGVLSPEERAAHEKHVFERAVGVPLDAELVQLNLDGRLLQRVQTLAEITAIWSKDYLRDHFDLLAEPAGLPRGRLQTITPGRMIGVLMLIAGLTTATGFKIGHLVTVASLDEFVRVCQENRTVIEEVFGEAIRGDLEKNPVRQLNQFLARVGLKLKLDRSEKTQNDGKLRYYSLDMNMVGRMTSLAASFSEVRRLREIEEEEGRSRRRDRTPQQGTAEDTPYMNTNTGLLSLADEDSVG